MTACASWQTAISDVLFCFLFCVVVAVVADLVVDSIPTDKLICALLPLGCNMGSSS